tara:strand:+ start:836 stop:1306 length:471 start_codon:yes stop_codon:yes gene_type:complete
MTAKALQDSGFPTALTDAQATSLGMKIYSHGTTYYNGLAPTLSPGNAQSGLVVNASAFIPYQMSNGSWRLKFNFNVSYTSTNYSATNLAGVGITNGVAQAISMSVGDSSLSNYENIPAANYLTATTTYFGNRFQSNASSMAFSGDIALTAKPTWAY